MTIEFRKDGKIGIIKIIGRLDASNLTFALCLKK